MESLSRIKRFQNLRETVESNQENETISPALSSFAERLNKINPVLSRAQDLNHKSDYEPLHIKRLVSQKQDVSHDENTILKTDYIHEFLDEVRQYNVNQGYRSEFNTDMEIIKHVKNPTEIDSSITDITQQIKTFMESDPADSTFEEIIDDSSLEEATIGLEDSHEFQVMIEETQKMKIKLDDYEKELQDMNESVLSSHRFLNYVVFALVLLLMIMLGFAIYWVLYSQGYY
jgi:hypothetical protein